MKALYDAIRARHAPEKWLLFMELRCGTGYKVLDAERRIDAYAIHLYPSESNIRHAYEVKASRNDFLRELRQPHKRRAGLRFSNYFWFVTPPLIIDPEEIPVGCGLIEVDIKDGETTVIREAAYRESVPPTWNFLTAAARHMQDRRP